MASGRRKRKKEPLEETHTQEVDGSSNVCPPSTVLPPCLASIEGTFSRLNTLLTFLGVQRQMLGITLAQAQAAFMSQTGSELTEDMLGQMVAIAPSLMNVFWLPEGLRKLEDDTFAIQGSSKESRTPKNYVLMIEFKDSRPPSVKKGTPSLSSSLKTQSIAVLSKKIQSRNAAFRKCLLDFAATHGLQHQELEKTLSQMGAESLPRKPQGDQATASQGLYSSSRGKPIQCERPRSLERMLKDLAKETFYNGQMGETLRSIPEKDALYGNHTACMI